MTNKGGCREAFRTKAHEERAKNDTLSGKRTERVGGKCVEKSMKTKY